MLLLGLDFETTGLNFEKDRIIEAGAVLLETDSATPMQIYNALVRHDDGVQIPDTITKLTGITPAMVETHGETPETVGAQISAMMEKAVAVVAHNGSRLDHPMFEAQMKRINRLVPAIPWIDTCLDLPFPSRMTTRKLTYLAAEHGFLNPFNHRAVFDVFTMFRILAEYPIEAVLESARHPIVTCVAVGLDETAEAPRKRGYYWRKGTKQWSKNLRQHQADGEKEAAGYEVEVTRFVPSQD